MRLSIVIPCYNEEDNIPLIIDRIISMTDDFSNLEILLINNGSTDNSAEVFTKHLANSNLPYIKLVNVEKNQGYGYGILAGLKQATGDVLGWTHADMHTDPVDVLAAFEKLLKHCPKEKILIKGRRKNRNTLDTVFTFGMSLVSSLVLKTWLSDVNAQPKVFFREFYNEMKNPPLDFSLDLYVLYLAKKIGYRTETIPVLFNKRLHGQAKGGGSLKTKWPLIKRTFSYILKLKKETGRTSDR